MTAPAPQPTRLADYRPFPYQPSDVKLTFKLAPNTTRVLARIRYTRNPNGAGEMRFDGERLKLISASIDGAALTNSDYSLDDTGLTLLRPLPESFVWESEVEIDPENNTALEGLYMSGGMYCTQCEAEGFRKITFYPDRPDVMATFHVRIESDLPVLLSNGNPAGSGPGWAEWDDPWPKPSYLFALVAGNLVAHSGKFTTASGREVDLNIWVRPGDEDKCEYALDALIRSMRWDEEVYGREYDLDVFNLVAVDDFNMGAMENKGLNIFNSALVLALPATATDKDYAAIERVVAHEYFHNWTGDRITCRDWFQLSLKEGLTVFRDQQFSADMRSEPVQRIEGVLNLRARQFREDAGPLAHQVRPDSYMEINNFYTATIYDKGAEVIRMLKTLVGDEGYKKALDLYFDRHDGQAATIEDWLTVFQDATGRDLSQFKLWYAQAGTPRVKVETDYADGTYRLTLTQTVPPTPSQPVKQPMVIPVAVGLLNPNGDEVVPTQVLELTEGRQTFEFTGLSAEPVPSILRGFSAPVILDHAVSAQERAFLLAHDTDPFNRWEAGRALARESLLRQILDDAPPSRDWPEAAAMAVRDASLDPDFRALVMSLPSGDDIAQALFEAGHTPDPFVIDAAIEALRRKLAQELAADLPALLASTEATGPYEPDAEGAGRRALRLALLALDARQDGVARAKALFASADNMTEELGALSVLCDQGAGAAETQAFYAKWRHDRLVIDKWFGLQVLNASAETAVDVAESLAAHPDFEWKNPNRFRALLRNFAGTAGFHHPSGRGYKLLADWLIKLDPLNPQTTARMSSVFETWRRYDAARQELMRAEMQRVLDVPGLSRDTTEMLSRIMAG